jgi:hypothetical protein
MLVVIGFTDEWRSKNPRVVYVGEKHSEAEAAALQSRSEGCKTWGSIRNPVLFPFKPAAEPTAESSSSQSVEPTKTKRKKNENP